MLVYVISKNGVRLMPCVRNRHVRMLLTERKAKVINKDPFTIQLLYDTEEITQDIDLKVDTGYQHVGISACSDKAELYSAEVELLSGQKQRLEERRKYRRQRRSRKRHRKCRFRNRRRDDGWLAPSVQHKVDSHMKAMTNVMKMLPVTKVVLEVANFDIQKLKNPDIQGNEYQQGEMYDFRNVREYIFFRDNYTCQICGKSAFKDGVQLHWHHVEYWRKNRSNAPANGLSVCTECHCSKNHQPDGVLWGRVAQQKPFKAETFMATVRKILFNTAKETFDIPVEATYGYLTKDKRIALKLDKTHFNDAYCIGEKQPALRLSNASFFKEKRKNNRELQKFYDAKYIDSRDDKRKSGKDLFSGRSTRNKNRNTENLHKYRKQKVSKGRISTRTKRYPMQPNDLITWKSRQWVVIGTHCNGTRVLVSGHGLKKQKSIAVKDIKLVNRAKTYYREERNAG